MAPSSGGAGQGQASSGAFSNPHRGAVSATYCPDFTDSHGAAYRDSSSDGGDQRPGAEHKLDRVAHDGDDLNLIFDRAPVHHIQLRRGRCGGRELRAGEHRRDCGQHAGGGTGAADRAGGPEEAARHSPAAGGWLSGDPRHLCRGAGMQTETRLFVRSVIRERTARPAAASVPVTPNPSQEEARPEPEIYRPPPGLVPPLRNGGVASPQASAPGAKPSSGVEDHYGMPAFVPPSADEEGSAET